MAGCLGGSDDAMPEEDLSSDAADPGEAEQEARENESWTRTFHLTPTFTWGMAVPFQHITWDGVCDLTPEVHVPAGATRLVTRIEESSQNSTGEGAMTFLMHSPDDEWIYPPGTVEKRFYRELPGTVEIVRDKPVAGNWWIWVWPHGHVVDQTWDLTITIEGTGPGAEDTGVFASDSPGSTECES